MTNRKLKILFWIPRILCILGILFISLFALDAFEGDATLKNKFIGFTIHLIPSFVLIAILLIAWKWEKIGGLIFIILGVFFSFYLFKFNYSMNQSIWISLAVIASICFPFIISGVLFVIHYLKSSKNI